jgi:hypothetical protein
MTIPWTMICLALAAPRRRLRCLARLAVTICLYSLASGCSFQPSRGLTPLEPAVEHQARSIWTAYTPVDTLQPVLAWEPFVADREPLVAADPVSAVRYEVRIWLTQGGYEGRLVYSRNDLVTTRHRVEEPLAPASRYLWSVRAIYERGGVLQLTPWAASSALVDDATVPNPGCYRFRTPALDGEATEQAPDT